MKKLKISNILVGGLLGTSCLTAASQAQDDTLRLEEIVVTAQKREQGLGDVPISVTAVTSTRLEQAGIQDMSDLSGLVANFQVNEDPIGDKINIRGIQSGNNAGIEQSIGTYVDGVYRGRGVQSRFAFLDVERVEVLRGSQGTLFGKNTIGGALNITSVKPTDDFEGKLSISHNFNFEDTGFEGALSGPLSDTLRARVAFVHRDMNKGWIHNAQYDEGAPQRSETAGRLSLDWDVSESTMLAFRYERGEFNVQAQPFSTLTAGPLALFGAIENGYDETNMGNAGFPAFGFGEFFDVGSAGTHKGDSEEISISSKTQLENIGELTIIAARSKYDFVRVLDADFGPVPGLRFDDTEDYEQKSLEFRIVSEGDNTLDYIVGAYYQDYKLKADGDTFYNTPFFHTILKAGCAGNGIDPNAFAANLGGVLGGDPAAAPALFAQVVDAGSAAVVRQCLLQAAATSPITGGSMDGFNRYHYLDMNSETIAAFAELTYKASDRLRFTGGLRYSEERKDATQGAYAADLGGRAQSSDPFDIYLLDALGETTPHAFTRDDLSRTEKSLTWSVKAQYDVSDNAMVYASASTGFKAGGYNSFAMRANPEEAEFEDEKALSLEMGSKMSVDDGRGEINIAVFYTKFDNLQTALFTGSTSFIVQNAASAKSKGIELDGRYLLTDNLILSASAGYLDFKYDIYPNAGCHVAQLLDLRESTYTSAIASFDPADPAGTMGGALLGALGSAQVTLQNCAAAEINDLAGRASEHAPKFTAALSLSHDLTLGDYTVASVLDWQWQDEQYRQGDLDPVSLDDAYSMLNFSMNVGPTDGNWGVSVLVKNITDTNFFAYMNDTPLFDGARQFIPGAPRSVTVRATLKF